MAKKRFKRWLIIGAALFLLLVVVGLLAAFNSGVQTAIARHYLAKYDPNAKLDRVSIGLSGGEVSGLNFIINGKVIKADSATAQFSLWNLAFGGTRTIDDLEIKGLVIDLTQPANTTTAATTTEPTSAGSKSATGLLIKKANIEAMVLLPQQRSAQLTLTAQDLGTSSSGTATGQVVFQDKSPDAKFSEMHADTQIALTLDAAMFPQIVDLAANLSAAIPGQAQPALLQAHLVAKQSNGANGSFTLDLAQPSATSATAANLLNLSGNYGNDNMVSGNFTADLSRAEVEPFAFGVKLPDFTLRGDGQLTADTAKGQVSVKAKLQGSAGHLGALRADLEQLGSVQMSVDVDCSWTQGADGKETFDGRSLMATLAPDGGQTALTLNLLQPVSFEYDTTTKSVKLTQGLVPELARLTLSQAPTAWVAMALPANYTLTGQNLTGEIDLGARADGAIVAKTTKPLTWTGLSLKLDQNQLLAGTDAELDTTITYEGSGDTQTVTIEIRKLLSSAHLVQMPGWTFTTTSAQGKIAIAQYAGNVTIHLGAKPITYETEGRLAAAVDVDNLDRKTLGVDMPNVAPKGLLTLDGLGSFSRTNSAFLLGAINNALNGGGPAPASGAASPSFVVTLKKGATVLATVQTLQQLSLPIDANGKVQTPTADGNVAVMEVNGLPLALLQPFLPKTMKITGEVTKGKVLLVGAGANISGFTWRTEVPVELADFLYAENGETKLSGVSVVVTPQGSWQSGEIKSTTRFDTNAVAGNLMHATVEVDKTPDNLAVGVSATGQLGALAAQPFAVEWRQYLPDPKPQYALNVNLTQTKDALTIDAGTGASVLPSGGVGAPLAEIKTSENVTLNIVPTADPALAAKGQTQYAWPQLNGNVLTLKITNLPAGVLGVLLPGYLLQGGGVSGDVLVQGEGHGDYSVSANAPLTAAGLSVTKTPAQGAPVPWVTDLTFTTLPAAKFNAKGLSYFSLQGTTITSGHSTLAAGDLELTRDATQSWWEQAKFNLHGDLAQFLKQPIMSKYDNLAAGQLGLTGELAHDGTLKFDAKVQGWTVLSPAASLISLSFSNVTGRIDHDASGNVGMQLNIPIDGLSNQGDSKCTVAFSLDPAGGARKFDLKVIGDSLIVDDLMTVKNAFFPPAAGGNNPAGVTSPSLPGAQAPATASASAGPDKTPLWGDLQGQAQVQVKHLIYSTYTLDNLDASAQITPTQASISHITTSFEGAPLQLSGTLAFDATQAAQPYNMQLKISLSNFDVGAYFKKRDPADKPPAEGKFSVDGSASGRGANLDDLIAGVPFDCKLTSGSGTFHLLDLVQKKNAAAGTVLQLGSGLAGLAAGILGGGKNKVSDSVNMVNGLMQALDTIEYNKLVFEAQRGADRNIKLTQFVVQNPTTQLTGTGQITYQAGVAIPDQALTATLQLNATGTTAQTLGDVGLLTSAKPQNGYYPGPSFEVGGSLQHLDYSGLYSLLGKAALGGVTHLILP